MKVADNETRWVKIGRITIVTFVGKEVLFYSTGCHLIFINMTTGEELIYTANTHKTGDGIRFYTGHRTQNVFTYAEKRTNPRIFIKTFPNFEEVHVLKGGTSRAYVNMAFSDSSLLVTIGDLPNFNIVVWNWRTGEKIASQDGNVLMEKQMLKCSFQSPLCFVHMGIYTRDLYLWDVHLCGKKCVLTEHKSKITEEQCEVFTTVNWTSEGGLFLLDTAGCIYTVFPDHHIEKVIDFTEPGPYHTSFAWYKFGITVSGPNQEIRHYKKSGNWTMDWNYVPPEPIQALVARFDYLVALTINHNIIHITQRGGHKYVKQNETQFTDICLVYPTGQYLLTLVCEKVLSLYKVSNGELLSTLDLQGRAMKMVENPKFPYAAVGFESGVIKLISAFNPDSLTKMTQFFLTKHPTDSISFNECGTVFVVGNRTIGRFFIIEGIPGGQMTIVATIDVNRQIADHMMIISQDCYRIFMIPVTSDEYIAGNVVLRYCFIKNKTTDIKEYSFEDKNCLYYRISGTFGITRDRNFYLVPYNGKTIHEVEIKKGDNLARVTRKIPTGHQMRGIRLSLTKRNALTWSYDGFVIARSSDFEQNVGIVLPHHRMDGGVKTAYLEPYEKYVVSLGRDGVLVCTNLMEKMINFKIKQELEQLQSSSDYKLLFSKRTIGYVPRGIYEGKCYLEVQEMKRVEMERHQCETERDSILQEFVSIQRELQELLTANIQGPENEKLDLKEFNLNTKLYEEKVDHHRQLRKATEIYLKQLIQAQNKITDYMMVNFWGKMKVPGTAIKAIFAHFEVTNYVLRPPNINREEILHWIRHQRKLERHLNDMNSFRPWEPIPENKLIEMISARPRLPRKDQHLTALSALETDAPETDELEDLETKIAFSGSDVARFIEVQDAHYLQNELQTYFQTELQWIISKSDCYKLKEYFNDKFDKTLVQKTKEMSTIMQKNSRLRHIISELNYFSEEKIDIIIEDPRWKYIENASSIIEIKDDEVPATPYISPSQQALIDAKAAEAERLRLLLLADDFRERALMAMMNGVLEVRWEDELRKDVPIPKCMVEKEPENYNEDDLRTIKDYEEKVQFLNSERERYKGLLRVEYAKLAKAVRENIKKFNAKLQDLLCLKLQVDAALSQESLKINRMKLFQHQRKVIIQKENEILQQIATNEEVVASLSKLIHTLHDDVNECKTYVDSFQVKDKFLDRAYRKDFQEMSLVVQEQAAKIFKRRPKVNFRAISSTTLLNELGKSIVSNAKPSLTLNNECLEFLKQLDNLDLYVGVPTIVDEHTYALICKHRRLRIEYEVKLKAAQSELAEAEATSSAFHKRLHHKKEVGVKLQNALNDIRQQFVSVMCDGTMQIVLPRGLVEIPLSGSLDDFKDAVLICRKDVEDINKIILNFGDNKIKALQLGINFRRKILALEWEHKRMRMLIQDLQEKIVDIEGVRLTKEIQFYLKSKDKEKAIPFETEVDLIKGSYENTIQDRKDKVKRMKKQISAIRAHDKATEKRIHELNVDVCELNLYKDQELDEKERTIIDMRIKTLLKRSKLIQQVQDSHHEILMLQTELELLRLKTFPTLKYKVF